VGSVLRQAIDGRLALDPTALALAFAADRADHLFNAVSGVEQFRRAGRWVLCDRYVLSSIAYQTGAGVSRDFVAAINAFAVQPDLTIFVDTDLDVCLERIAARSTRDELFHNREALAATLAGYREALAGVRDPLVVDGNAPVEAVAEAVWAGVESQLLHTTA
jgi:dTMP kinase